ncbi:molybdenum cofactor guanylyltransferase [Alteromonas sp. 14N.309.X.WAT.G.H12]|uniref:molybdenum cofactor guanylyltransferase n=1 Tax=Alteromonas sp. 14N.309.X.WAT.G.H12 TaxID=3120824 RepID=UPI002FCFC287
MKTVGFILCGGASSRMGEDKSALVFEGKTLLTRARHTLVPVCDDVYTVGRNGTDLIDDKPLAGPAWAILSAMQKVEEATPMRVVVLPVDMPLCQTKAIKTLLDASEVSKTSVFAEGYLMPLVLQTDATGLAKISRVCAKEQSLSVRYLLSLFGSQPVAMTGFSNNTFMNVNNKEDWQNLQKACQNQ